MHHQRLTGDCFDILPSLEEPNLVLADPPYGITRQAWDTDVDWERWWGLISAWECPVLLFAAPPFDKRLAATNWKQYRYDWVWEKAQPTGFLNANRRPLQAHEQILVFYAKQPVYNPQKSTGHKPVNPVYTRKGGACYGEVKVPAARGGNTDRHPRTVLHYPAVSNCKKRHPNEKPSGLLRFLIRSYTNPGDIVLDPFAGSRSTGEAAEAEGRRSITIEMESSP